MKKYINSVSDTIRQNKAAILASLVTTIVTVFISFAAFWVWFQETKTKDYESSIGENRVNIVEHRLKIEKLMKDIDKSNIKLEKEIKRYIERNYGELSERDENVTKLIFLYDQQERRLSALESALSKF